MQEKHFIDLGASPRPPAGRFEEKKHESKINGKSVVEIELRSDDNLYIDGRKIVLHLSERQMGGKRVVGHELLEELEGSELVLLNSNVHDYIYEHPELFPEHWKKNEWGETPVIFFFGSIFQRPSPSFGGPCVCALYWTGRELDKYFQWLDYSWIRPDPSASLASLPG